MILVGVIEAERPADAIADNVKGPVKPRSASTVIMSLLDTPASRGPMLVELAVRSKSGPRIAGETENSTFVE